MKFRLFAAAVLLSAVTLTAGAQDDAPAAATPAVPSPYRNDMGLYLVPVFTYVHNSESDTGPFAFLGEGKNSQWFRGAAIGFQDDFYHSEANNWGMDMRLTLERGNGAALDTFLLGVRYVRTLDGSKVRPFAELLGGVGGTAAAHNPHRVSRPMFQASAGADYPLFKHLDWRVAEVSYSQVRTVGADSFLGNDVLNRPSAMTIGVGSGLVLRF